MERNVKSLRSANQDLLSWAVILALLGIVAVIGMGQIPLVRMTLPAQILLVSVAGAAAAVVALSRIEYGILVLPNGHPEQACRQPAVCRIPVRGVDRPDAHPP